MSTGEPTRRTGWETTLANLAADAALADAALYASGARRLTVDHGQPLTDAAEMLLQRLVDDVDAAAAAAGYLGGGLLTRRATSITWTFPATDVPARQLVLAARTAADWLNPGDWIITADEHE